MSPVLQRIFSPALGAPPDPLLAAGSQPSVSLPWLVRLRWGAVAAQLSTLLVVHQVLGIALPLVPALGCVAATAASNAWVAQQIRRGRCVSRRTGGILLCLDTLLLTVLLHLTGGPTNPFSILYLVYITVAAVMLKATWTRALGLVAVTCYGLLFLLALPRGGANLDHAPMAEFSMHLQGMWIAFAIATALIAHFVVQLSAAIDRRDAEIIAARDRAARGERLAALATLAAGAAHELATPLGTIAIAAKELERALTRLPAAEAGPLFEDARLIRAELERCRRILDQMAARSGETRGEVPGTVSVKALLEDVLNELPPEDAARVTVSTISAARTLAVPRHALAKALTNLVRNAVDAAPSGKSICLGVDEVAGSLRFSVHDEGPGMSTDVLARAGEPFFSTKPHGRGMGLGLFLTRAIAEQIGGRLSLESVAGRGVTATIDLPASVLGTDSSNASA